MHEGSCLSLRIEYLIALSYLPQTPYNSDMDQTYGLIYVAIINPGNEAFLSFLN